MAPEIEKGRLRVTIGGNMVFITYETTAGYVHC